MIDPRSVLDFWFSAQARALWFEQDKAFDAEIAARFGAAIHDAQLGGLEAWADNPTGALALLILLDQMSRNIYRGQAKAFLGDPRARAIASAAIAREFDKGLPYEQRSFFYLPFEHGEDMASQDRAVHLFTQLFESATADDKAVAEIQLDYAHRHRDVIKRFGRFPHRNDAMGRPSTEDEIDFLKKPGSSF